MDRTDCRTVTDRPLPKGPRYLHPNAIRDHDGDCLDGCCDGWKCPDCGTSWTVELPE